MSENNLFISFKKIITMIQIYHNPRCGKSRNCLAMLDDSGQDHEIIKYLEQPPTYIELVSLLKKLNMKPLQLVRQKEKIWIQNFKNKTMTDDEIIQAMISNPILIERPIVIKEGKAIIGRDLDKLTAFI
ncbi:arsenate reductase [Flavobacterium frigoris PS1]|uniref:Arsenate reductase n=2 Tax=Flavobacterium frigoris TaxID=229204 RepID=H7FU60_FLAFP|nr:arsenate reductase [Flavobacterium frigoris PS1]